MMNGTENDVDPSSQLFDQLITAVTCKSILSTFHDLCDCLGITNTDHRNFYKQLKSKLTSWKAKSLWIKLDKRAAHRDYKKMEACPNTKVLIIGAGPCGLRMAIEVALMGARAVVVEKRDRFSRNNVLHLWNFVIADLRNLGAKKFFGKFCAGSIEHISIRQLQCILLKVALLLGVEVHVNVAFEELIEPPEDQSTSVGWRCRLTPSNHPVSEYQFDVLIGADGKRNTVPGFRRKEFRGKLAIAITANFINRNTNAEARVEEISGVAFIFNQKFFLDLKEKTGIDLENIVYYKDETHYFVMTAKKASLLEKGVLKEDYSDTIQLLSRENVDQDALLSYAKEAANFSTNQQLPNLDYAVNHYGQADIAMFDFTSMFAAENACRALERNGHKLFIGIAGDSLLEPFWPTGSGCARGFMGVFDAAWMIKSLASGKMSPLQVIAERESIYQLLSQTTPENLHKNHNQYSIDPNTRYPNLNFKNRLKPIQVKHLYDGPITDLLIEEAVEDIPSKRARNMGPSAINNDLIDSYSLLRWCQRVLNSGRFRNVHVVDFAGSWRNGLAFCALIHAFRPTLLDFNLLMESDVAKNNQLAFDVAEKELAVPPVMTGEDMAKSQIPDKLTLVSYISQLYAIFRMEPLPTVCDDNLEFCEKTGCYIRVGDQEEVSSTVFNRGAGRCSFRVSSRKGRLPIRRQLSYEKLPDWVKNAASRESMSEDSEGPESDGTTADGSITIWETDKQRGTWSDSDSTDDEVYAPINVQSLKKFYEGPRGYPMSTHRPKNTAVQKPKVTVDHEPFSNVSESLSVKELESQSMVIDDSQFKTLTQEDVDNFASESGHEKTLKTEDDDFKTLTQDDVGNPSSDIKYEIPAQINDNVVQTPSQNVQTVDPESHQNIRGICDNDFKTLTQEDIDMKEAEADVESSDDEIFVKQDVNFLTKKWTQMAEKEALDRSVEEKRLTKRKSSSQTAERKLFQNEQKQSVVDTEASTEDQEGVERQDGVSQAGDRLREMTSHDTCPGEIVAVSGKSDADTLKKEKKQTERKLAKSHNVRVKPKKSPVQTSAPMYRYSATRIGVMLPGLMPNNESSTDEVMPLKVTEKMDKSDTEMKPDIEMKEAQLEREVSPIDKGGEGPDDINFKAAKRKFQDLSKESESTSKKLDRRSSTRSPKKPQHRSYIDIMKDNHPSAATSMSIDQRDKQGHHVSVSNLSEISDRHHQEDSTHQAKDEDGKLEFVMGSEQREGGIVNLGGTFSHLETASSTDTDIPGHDAVIINLPPVSEIERQEMNQSVDPNNETPDTTVDDIRQQALTSNSETGTLGSCCGGGESDDEYHDAKEFHSLNIPREANSSNNADTSDIDDSLYQTACEFPGNDSKLSSNSEDADTSATINEEMFTTATDSQLASRLKLVSVSEDCVTSEDKAVSSGDPKGTSVSEDTAGSRKQKVSSKTCVVV